MLLINFAWFNLDLFNASLGTGTEVLKSKETGSTNCIHI